MIKTTVPDVATKQDVYFRRFLNCVTKLIKQYAYLLTCANKIKQLRNKPICASNLFKQLRKHLNTFSGSFQATPGPNMATMAYLWENMHNSESV